MIKTPEQIKNIKIAGKILANVAKKIKDEIKIGVSLKELDKLTERLTREAGAEPVFLGYQPSGAGRPFPASICASLNDVVVHGVPSNYKLKNGDLLSLDFGVAYKGFIADSAFTVGVGKISDQAKRLMEVTKNALVLGIKECKPNKTLGDIGYAINNYVSKNGFKVVRGLCGHGVGLELHEEPSVLNEGKKGMGMKLKAGMVLALEPMVSAGSPNLIRRKDEGYATSDKSLSAHFEHTVLITDGEPEILTR